MSTQETASRVKVATDALQSIGMARGLGDLLQGAQHPAPQTAGIYAWYVLWPAHSDEWPAEAAPPQAPWWVAEARTIEAETGEGEWRLIYVGIAPGRAPKEGADPSSSNLRKRLGQHARSKAGSSTLRRTLGALLAQELGLGAKLSERGKVTEFLLQDGASADTAGGEWAVRSGESVLSAWMAEHLRVVVAEDHAPWEIEADVIAELRPTLNSDHQPNAHFRQQTRAAKDALKALAIGP